MAERRNGEGTEDGAAHVGRPDASAHRFGYHTLPAVESPPLSPVDPGPVPAAKHKLQPQPEPEVAAAVEKAATEKPDKPVSGGGVAARLRIGMSVTRRLLNLVPLPSWPRFRLPAPPLANMKPRHRRRAKLAATVALAAAFGAIVGSLVGGAADTPPPDNTAHSPIAQLTRQIAVLKTELAAIERTAEKTVEAATVKSPLPDTTGSIQPAPVTMPTPPPRLAGQIATAVSRPPVVRGWTLRVARNGLFLVEGRGEIYQVVQDAPLLGLWPVQAIRRQDGRWIVVTPKGLIVSRRDRRYFE